MMNLTELLSQEQPDIAAVSEYFDKALRQAVTDVNDSFSPERLSKQLRSIEPLPIDTRQLSSYRTRMGTMLEYAIGTSLARLIKGQYGAAFLLTFANAHEYPDFFLRDQSLRILLRIEMKAVDADSDEQAARFSTPTAWIDSDRDLLLLVAWEWRPIAAADVPYGEYPFIFASLILPAAEIAKERDVRLGLTGGRIDEETVYVPSKKGGFGADPGNYGKFWRILHQSRLADRKRLSPFIMRFLEFLEEVNRHASRKRSMGRGRGTMDLKEASAEWPSLFDDAEDTSAE